MQKYGIDYKDISVVIQGAIDKVNTPRSVQSIRKVLPGAEIILSTWEGSNVNGITADRTLFNSDPGGYKDKFNTNFTNNTLRQIVSSRNGTLIAEGKFILKIRSDLILKSDSFLSYFDKYQVKDYKFSLFEKKIIVSSFFTKKYCSNGIESMPLPFHLSDWIVFGTKADIRYLYDIPLPEEPYNAWYLYEKNRYTTCIDLLHMSHRYAPEQYIFYQCCKKRFANLKFDNYLDYNEENIDMYDKLLLNNCIILDPNQWKFICGKVKGGNDYYKLWTYIPWIIPDKLRIGLYTNKLFEKEYKKIENIYK